MKFNEKHRNLYKTTTNSTTQVNYLNLKRVRLQKNCTIELPTEDVGEEPSKLLSTILENFC